MISFTVIRKTKMFDWFNKKKIEEDTLKHFKPQWMPQEEPERTYLAIGPTSKGRVSIKLNYGVVTMDEVGINCLIKSLLKDSEYSPSPITWSITFFFFCKIL